VTFVGNPTMSKDFSKAKAARARKALGAAADDQILLVLPGSRPSEIKRLMGPFGEAVGLLKASHPQLLVALPTAGLVAAQVREAVAAWSTSVQIIEDEDAKYDAMKAATVALACSGTVSTELALCGAPMVIAYRLGEATYQIVKRLIRTPWITLVNIAAGKMIAPEFVQDECTGQNLAAAVAARLDDKALRTNQIAEQDAALALMGRGQADPYAQAADIVVGLIAEA
jgi:lipid-A-disaccharide synthase